MRPKFSYDLLHTDDFSPYARFFDHGMLFLSLMYKMVLFCLRRVGYTCMLSFGCRHLAICADSVDCSGHKKILNFSVSYTDLFFQLIHQRFRMFHQKNWTAQEITVRIAHILHYFNSSLFKGKLMNLTSTVCFSQIS